MNHSPLSFGGSHHKQNAMRLLWWLPPDHHKRDVAGLARFCGRMLQASSLWASIFPGFLARSPSIQLWEWASPNHPEKSI